MCACIEQLSISWMDQLCALWLIMTRWLSRRTAKRRLLSVCCYCRFVMRTGWCLLLAIGSSWLIDWRDCMSRSSDAACSVRKHNRMHLGVRTTKHVISITDCCCNNQSLSSQSGNAAFHQPIIVHNNRSMCAHSDGWLDSLIVTPKLIFGSLFAKPASGGSSGGFLSHSGAICWPDNFGSDFRVKNDGQIHFRFVTKWNIFPTITTMVVLCDMREILYTVH